MGCIVAESPERAVTTELRTADSGRTWQVIAPFVPLEVCASGSAVDPLNDRAENAFHLGDRQATTDLAIVDTSTAWASVLDFGPSGGLARTLDGGTTWTEYDWPEETDPLGDSVSPIDVSFVDSQHGWVLSWDGSIYRTLNGGATWAELP